MAKRFQHATTGAVVEVRDDKVLGSEWIPEGSQSQRSESPDSTWKVAELKAHAADNEIDLGDATKKDDILAAIAGAASSSAGSGEDPGGSSSPDSDPGE